MNGDDGRLSEAQEAEFARELERRKAQNVSYVNNVRDIAEARAKKAEDELHAILRQHRGRPTYKISLACVRALYGDHLAYNEMAEADELNGRRFRDADYGRMADLIEQKYAMACSIESLRLAVTQLCDERRYHPVRHYLETLPPWDGVSRWRLLPSTLFGHSFVEDPYAPAPPLAATALERFAIACVARALSPGCQVDTVLILQGKQGFKKTTFFRALAGAWHGEGAMDIHSNKAPLLLGASWIWVWDELTTIMRGREEVAVKDFVSRLKDCLIKPYGRHAIEKPRSSVIAGTTNAEEILTDVTGDRRYWIVRVFKRVDADLVLACRDQLWAEALHLYRAREQWHLTDAEEEERDLQASEWRAPEAWLEPVAHWVRSQDAERLLAKHGYLTAHDVAGGLGVPVEKRDKAVLTRVGVALAQLDWSATARRREGKVRLRLWVPPTRPT